MHAPVRVEEPADAAWWLTVLREAFEMRLGQKRQTALGKEVDLARRQRLLEKADVDFAQGYHVGRPRPLRELLEPPRK